MYTLNDKIKDLEPYSPVTKQYRVSLNANESFLEPPESLLAELKAEIDKIRFNRYPDSTAGGLCRAFAEYWGIPAENVAAGNGSDELISVIFSAFLKKGETFATIEPDFSMYGFYGHMTEARQIKIEKRADMSVDVDSVIDVCRKENVRLLIFSNPCNPTSVGICREQVRRLISSVDALVVLDEAYMDFYGQSLLSEFESFDNLIVLRTCSKAFGLAGLRIGFAVARSELVNAVKAVKSPYNLNAVSQAFGRIILSHRDMLIEASKKVIASRDSLYAGLLELQKDFPCSFETVKPDTNFVVLRMQEPEKLFDFLGKNGISVRYTAGLIRITCGTQDENAEVLSWLRRYFESCRKSK